MNDANESKGPIGEDFYDFYTEEEALDPKGIPGKKVSKKNTKQKNTKNLNADKSANVKDVSDS